MTVSLVPGQSSWSGVRNNDGQRTYILTNKVRAASTDGPAKVMTTPGLPLVGSLWIVDSDIDLWAFCHPDMRVTPVKKNQPNRDWIVEQTFSTKPIRRCQDTEIEDPLLEPQRISGSFISSQTDPDTQLKDKDGDLIQTISFEPFKGLAFDDSNHQVNIGQNIATLGLSTIADMIDTVNDDVLWGFPARQVKLSQISWSRKIFGTCGYYYSREFGFLIDTDGFDRVLFEEGTKTLKAGGTITDPSDWEVAKDDNDETTVTIPLNAAGAQATSAGDVATRTVEYYSESNFLTLGIPTTIGL